MVVGMPRKRNNRTKERDRIGRAEDRLRGWGYKTRAFQTWSILTKTHGWITPHADLWGLFDIAARYTRNDELHIPFRFVQVSNETGYRDKAHLLVDAGPWRGLTVMGVELWVARVKAPLLVWRLTNTGWVGINEQDHEMKEVTCSVCGQLMVMTPTPGWRHSVQANHLGIPS